MGGRLVSLCLAVVLAAGFASAEDVEWKFGVTVPLAGEFASYGQSIREGLELAREQAAAQGVKIKLVYEDACLPAAAVTALKRLAEVEKIQALAGNFCVIGMAAMAPQIEKYRLPAFQTAAASDSVINSGDYIFTTNLVVRDEAVRLAEHAYQNLKVRTVSILYITTDFGGDYNRYFSKRFAELGGKILSSQTSAIGVNDFRAELTQIKALKPDAIFAATSGQTLGVLLKQARQLGLRQLVFSTYEAEDPSVLELGGEAAEGLAFFTPDSASESPIVQQFAVDYARRFGHPPLVLAANSYDALMLLAGAFRKCGGGSECVKSELYRISSYSGVSGIFSINPDGGTRKELVLKEVRGQKFVHAAAPQ